MPEIVPKLPSARCLSKASSDGDVSENMANADMRASGKERPASSQRWSGMVAKLFCTKRKSASAQRCLRCLGATIDIVNPITRTANRSGQGGILTSMFTKGQHRGHGEHWAWRLTGNYCIHIDIQEGAAWCAQSLLVGQDMNPGVP